MSDSTQIASSSLRSLITDGLRKPSSSVGTMMSSADLRQDADYRVVVRELIDHTSMPYLELVAISPVNNEKLAQIIDDLERRHLVSVKERSAPTDALITVRAGSYDQLAQFVRA